MTNILLKVSSVDEGPAQLLHLQHRGTVDTENCTEQKSTKSKHAKRLVRTDSITS
jgi:hypothetical protein